MTTFFDFLLKPFQSVHPLWGLMWISALSGIMMIFLFKKTSDQQAIYLLRRKMGSRALGMLLFLESPATVLKLAFGLITDNFIYLWHLLKPIFIITVPFLLISAQLDARYSRMPLDHNNPATVTVYWENKIPVPAAAIPEEGTLTSPIVTVTDSLEQSFSFAGNNGVFVYNAMGIVLGSNGASGNIVIRGAEHGGTMQAFFRPWNTESGQGIRKIHAHIRETQYDILGGRWSWFSVFLVFSSAWALVGAIVFRVKV